uniref:Uncharacterized protein n=1 Tax=Fagus sylvatica TaxID=28930 RepID=A0A2N9EI65_FAGSY
MLGEPRALYVAIAELGSGAGVGVGVVEVEAEGVGGECECERVGGQNGKRIVGGSCCCWWWVDGLRWCLWVRAEEEVDLVSSQLCGTDSTPLGDESATSEISLELLS